MVQAHDSLDTRVRRLHSGVLVLAMVAVLVLAPSIGVRAWPTVAILASGAVLSRTSISMTAVLASDLVLALSLWWLFGPVSGANFIPYVVISLGPLLLPSLQARLLLVAAFLTIATEAVLHLLASRVAFPLFHPPDPIPDGEFFAGLAIQAILLVAVGALMVHIADSLNAGRQALAADLDRQRELHRMKDSFLATASHQLRTPLTALRGFSRLLLERDLAESERDEYVGLVVSQTEEMYTLVEDLITFNRIEAGEFSVRLEPVHPATVIETIVRGMGPIAADVDIDVDPDIVVQADPLRLTQMIRNLVDNAIRYGKSPVTIVGSRADDWFRCVISDAGPGMSEEEAARSFDPYVRLVSNETMSEPGLGLGLAVVRELANRHGGAVRYLGPTTGFELAIPLTSASAASAQLSNSVVAGW